MFLKWEFFKAVNVASKVFHVLKNALFKAQVLITKITIFFCQVQYYISEYL